MQTLLYGATIFLGAWLLFLVQPLIGKYVLPWFGGAPAVWTTCMLFFQTLLLAGYGYSHILTGRIAPRRQPLVHLFLLSVTLLLLPIIPSDAWQPTAEQSPVWRIMGLLLITIGAPYLLLAATGPLLQVWFSRERDGGSPYRLYSLSNFASLLAIGCYPFVIEPRLSLNFQARGWSWCYGLFALLCMTVAVRVFIQERGRATANTAAIPEGAPLKEEEPPSPGNRLLWLSLAACGSIMLLASTNQLCQDVAVVPLLWLLPLGIYLLSFILCFHHERWYSRRIFLPALILTMAQACYILYEGVFAELLVQIASYSITLFVCCMICHGELYRLRPSTRFLTSFYMMVAAGGALGGISVTVAAPRIFKGFWEYHLGLFLVCLLVVVILFGDKRGRLYRGNPLWAWTLLNGGLVALGVSLAVHIYDTKKDNLEMTRNFFGVLRVLDQDKSDPGSHKFTLMHGRIEHGFQFQDREKRYWPTSYFGPDSGIGVSIQFHPNRATEPEQQDPLRVGVVGLGTGTIATYGQEGDVFRFYEINPAVAQLSEKLFTYRRDSGARVEVVLGDARVSMERERRQGQSQQFDILAVDAFSSDAIPVHLLTQECYRTYRYHLKPDGILAIHISSRYFDLHPVVLGMIEVDRTPGMETLFVSSVRSETLGIDRSDWVLLTKNHEFLNAEGLRLMSRQWPTDTPPPAIWTDDYSNIFELLK